MKQFNNFPLSLRVICTRGKVLGSGPRTIYRLQIVGHILSNFREPKDRGVRSGHWAFMRQSDRVFIDWGGKGVSWWAEFWGGIFEQIRLSESPCPLHGRVLVRACALALFQHFNLVGGSELPESLTGFP